MSERLQVNVCQNSESRFRRCSYRESKHPTNSVGALCYCS